ncbi:hypothetical protein LOZ66_004666 [Ophidiomyces ophidiicola]|nr:hypothetical protein LOZ66_004666 [Ophidiomyces ophidiicola]
MYCDEHPPCCRNCQKRQITCDYEAQFGTAINSAPAAMNVAEPTIQIQIHPLSGAAGSVVSECRRPELWRKAPPAPRTAVERPLRPISLPHQDIELMRHYTAFTSLSLSEDGRKRMIWQFTIPQQAQSFPFLMDNLLSLAALHLAYLRPSEQKKYTYLAAKYQAQCIKGAQQRTPGITGENCSAVIVCTGLLLLHELAILHPLYFSQARLSDPLDEFLGKVLLMRRILVLWQFGMNLFKAGPARDLVLRRTAATSSSPLAEARAALDQLHALNRTMTRSEAEMNAYTNTIECLFPCYEEALGTPPDWVTTIAWPLYVPELYMQLLGQKQPLALVILAHFVALLSFPVGRWWASSWPSSVLSALAQSIENPWHLCLILPARNVGVALKPDR